ncbi:hypothetical protein LC612_36130 [Nostoc sp. CHAB 5834]|nr:hypothetical protein [Nostoc sp. CHAB 5834]
MVNIEQKLDKVLTFSNSGKWLKASDIYLLDRFEKGVATDEDAARLDELYEATKTDLRPEFPETFFGLERLSNDNVGYVYWLKEPGNLDKRVQVEHFSHDSVMDMLKAAERLQSIGLELEAKGFPVNGRTVLSELTRKAPADTPWLNALLKGYCFFTGNDRYVVILYSRVSGGMVVLENVDGQVKVNHVDEAYNAFHYVQNQGLKAVMMHSLNYEQFCQFFDAAGLTSADLETALDQEKPLEDVPF